MHIATAIGVIAVAVVVVAAIAVGVGVGIVAVAVAAVVMMSVAMIVVMGIMVITMVVAIVAVMWIIVMRIVVIVIMIVIIIMRRVVVVHIVMIWIVVVGVVGRMMLYHVWSVPKRVIGRPVPNGVIVGGVEWREYYGARCGPYHRAACGYRGINLVVIHGSPGLRAVETLDPDGVGVIYVVLYDIYLCAGHLAYK